ncbi:hypothetical protein ACQUFH_12695 [Lactococcus lactis]|uniref:hypothetical protein n=2 Tax=Lactococcus TaxID=1357 RepID=UPI0033675BA3
MKYKFSNEKLEYILDELGEEYKSLLVEKSLDKNGNVDVDNINLSDLIELDIETKKPLKISKLEKTRKRMFSLSALIGIIYVMIGGLMLILRPYRTNINNRLITEFSFIVIFMGMLVFLLSVYASVFLDLKRRRSSNKDISPYALFNNWKEIEALITQLTPDEYHKGPRTMVEYLSRNRMISSEDKKQILELLQIRNKIVHSSEDNLKMSKVELQKKIKMANKLIDNLSKLI